MLNILKGVKFAQDDSTGDVYAVDCVDGPKKLTGGSSGGGGAAWDAVILCETDNAEILENFTYTSGNYENITNKLAAKQPANIAVIVHAASGGDEAVYQSAATHVQFFNTAEQIGIMLYAQQVSSSFPLMLLPDGTITKVEG